MRNSHSIPEDGIIPVILGTSSVPFRALFRRRMQLASLCSLMLPTASPVPPQYLSTALLSFLSHGCSAGTQTAQGSPACLRPLHRKCEFPAFSYIRKAAGWLWLLDVMLFPHPDCHITNAQASSPRAQGFPPAPLHRVSPREVFCDTLGLLLTVFFALGSLSTP